MNESIQKEIFQKKFEELKQYNKIEELLKLKIITFHTSTYFHKIRAIRNAYLHVDKTDKTSEKDAEKIFYYTNEMLKNTLQVEIKDRKILINKQIGKYIQSKSLH